MAKDRAAVMAPHLAGWGIPPEAATAFNDRIQAAETALAAAKNETTRTRRPPPVRPEALT
jgi:hypothetical protein